MREGFDELILGDTVLDGVAEVEGELVVVAAGGENRDGDQAAVAGDSSGRFQTSSKSTSSVSSASFGANSPSVRRPPPTCFGWSAMG